MPMVTRDRKTFRVDHLNGNGVIPEGEWYEILEPDSLSWAEQARFEVSQASKIEAPNVFAGPQQRGGGPAGQQSAPMEIKVNRHWLTVQKLATYVVAWSHTGPNNRPLAITEQTVQELTVATKDILLAAINAREEGLGHTIVVDEDEVGKGLLLSQERVIEGKAHSHQSQVMRPPSQSD